MSAAMNANEFAAVIREAEALRWLTENVEPLLATLDPETPHVFGEDFGRSGDLTVIVPLAILKSLVRRAPFIVELRNVPFEQQWQILKFIADRLPRLRAGKLDARGNGSYIAEVAMQAYGETRIECVMLTEPWYREQMPPMKAAFEDGTIQLPKDRDVQDDIRGLTFIRGVLRVPDKRTKDGEGHGRHGDAAIAIALAHAASRAEVELYEYESHPQQPAGGAAKWHDTAEEQALADEEDDAKGRAPGLFPALRGGMLPRPRGTAL